MPAKFVRLKIMDDPKKRVEALKKGMRNRILRKACRAGAKVVREAIKPLVPKLTGALRSSIAVRIGTSKKTGSVYAVIGPRRRFSSKRKGKVLSAGKPTKYSHLVEGGTRPHSLKRKSGNKGIFKNRGRFMRAIAIGGRTLLRSRHVRSIARLLLGRKMHPGAKPKPFLSPAWRASGSLAGEEMRRVIEAELKTIDAG